MSRTTDECLTLARRAREVGEQCLPRHSHLCSPKKFTQPQLFAMLVLRQSLGWTYRATATRLREWSDLRQAIGIEHVPDASTLCYAQRRIFSEKTPIGCLIKACATPTHGAS